jgi:predicted transcriptional regulator of viral defense system
MAAPSPLTAVLDAAERAGKLNLRMDDFRRALPRVSPEALRQALHRQQRRGRLIRLSRGSNHWLIVPLQYAAAGAPPLETWLDRYMGKTLGIPYYVALLSAAETYGASPYGVMVTQVMVPERRRPITVGRHEVVFHTCSRIEHMPTRWHETSDGRFKVGTPELTALELVQRETAVGGMARQREVLRALWPSCTPRSLSEALEALQEVATAQRLGALLALDNQDVLASRVCKWLSDKTLRIIPLESGRALGTASEVDIVFKVRFPARPGNARASRAVRQLDRAHRATKHTRESGKDEKP